MEINNSNNNMSEVDALLAEIESLDLDSILAEADDLDIDTLLSETNNTSTNTETSMGDIDIVSTDEINKFLFELEADTSILRKRPSDVSGEKELFQLKALEEIYVLPLQELANRINMKLNNSRVEFYGLEGLSITGKSMKIRDFLLSKGCTKEMFMQVVPKTEAEINLLLTARAQGFYLGFQDNQTLDNGDRVFRARQHLDSLTKNNQENYGRSK